jgi:lipopolysaccharide transport system ATP-binding protein
VSHSAVQIVELCKKAILLDAGEKLASGNPKLVVGSYQKLLYSPDDKKETIRAQIRNNNIFVDNHGRLVCKSPVKAQLSSGKQDELQEVFDPNLKPTCTIDYESYGPVIGQPELLTLAGERVNGIVRGRKYRFFYRVVFNKTASNVRFGMLIKTKSGMSLGGALTAPCLNKTIPFISAGKRVDVEFRFKCYLNPGVYFMNAGVFGFRDEEETVLHRRDDVISFRVLPVADNIATEIIDFGFEPEVRFDEKDI